MFLRFRAQEAGVNENFVSEKQKMFREFLKTRFVPAIVSPHLAR